MESFLESWCFTGDITIWNWVYIIALIVIIAVFSYFMVAWLYWKMGWSFGKGFNIYEYWASKDSFES